MADTATPGIPTSSELLDLLAEFDSAWREASDASAARDRVNAVLDPVKHDQLHRVAGDKHYALGEAKEALRSAIARTRTALDHVHACSQPSNGELVRTVADRDRRIQELISERDELRERVETLGGNAEPVLEHPGQWLPGDKIDWDGTPWTRQDQRTWTGPSGVVKLGDTSINNLLRSGEARITGLADRPAADVAKAV